MQRCKLLMNCKVSRTIQLVSLSKRSLHKNIDQAQQNSATGFVPRKPTKLKWEPHIDMGSLQWRTKHPKLIQFVEDHVRHCEPDNIYVMDGSEEEYRTLCQLMVKKGTLIELDQTKRPNSYLARSTVDDVARLEKKTFICSETKEEAGPTNHWMDPLQMNQILSSKFKGCMRGRTMYVIPFAMGPLHSPIAKFGVQITDSPYVAASMTIMTRVTSEVFNLIGATGDFVPCVHSCGMPLNDEIKDSSWPSNSTEKYISHFPEQRFIASYGSNYGGNALLGKKCFALRIASVMARDEGWLAEHMLILGVTNPQGIKKYVAAAFPSACGKTNFALQKPSIPGWKVEIIGDDICWMKPGKDGRLYAINPENGFFGVAPGTNNKTNPNILKTIHRDTIFTNVALTEDRDVWWEGLTKEIPKNLIDWKGQHYNHLVHAEPAAHPNSRFATPIKNCPVLDDKFEANEGVPISAIIFGGRRSDTIPLVVESFDWKHGVFMGATLRSEPTKAAIDVSSEIRNDPFAMLPFVGYNMADYFQHWLEIERTSLSPKHLPKIFTVNWFQRDASKEFLWPGFSDNSRVLKWIFERTEDKSQNAVKTPIGWVPPRNSLDISGIQISNEHLEQLFRVDKHLWKRELEDASKFFDVFGSRMPSVLQDQITRLKNNLRDMN